MTEETDTTQALWELDSKHAWSFRARDERAGGKGCPGFYGLRLPGDAG